jgi:hypothetical protein
MSDQKPERPDLSYAKEAHKQFHADRIETFKPIFVFASEGLKTLQICHGGAMTATLAYAGFSMQRQGPMYPSLFWAFVFFATGLVLVIGSWLASHQSQTAFSYSAKETALIWEHPYLKETPESKRLEQRGDLLRSVALCAAIASGVMLIAGLISLGVLLKP